METIVAWSKSSLPEIGIVFYFMKKLDNTGWPMTAAVDIIKPKAGKQVSLFNRLKNMCE